MSTDAVGDPISMVAGETRVIELRVVDSEGLSVDLEGATAVFAVEKVLEKACTITGDTLMVKILPTETSKPSVTEYEFRIRDRDTDVDSIIKGEFTILKRVVSKEWGV